MTTTVLNRVVEEFAQADLGDARLRARIRVIAARAVSNPDASFPEMMSTDAELEAFYRFANNDDVDLQTLLAPHFAATHALTGTQTTIVAHDTTECFFSESVDGMGFIGKHAGFLVHTALAVTKGKNRVPLGLMGMMPIVRPKPQTSGKKKHSATSAKESNRWRALIERVEANARDGERLIHVLDREGDIYALLSWMTVQNYRFVVRVGANRRIIDENDAYAGSIWENLAAFKEVARRTVCVSKRDNETNARKKRVHASRDEREADLSIRTGVLRFPRPSTNSAVNAKLDTLEFNFVYAIEDSPPDGEAPIEWLLMTSEKIERGADALKVVDYYRARWRIEEYFKALKTGCAFEKRQAESLSTLLAVLGILAPIAWQLLSLRTMAREDETAPATTVLRDTQIAALVAIKRLRVGATVTDALYAIAGYGGHIKNNGPPGWITIARGMEKLEMLELGFIAGRQEM